MGSPASIRPNLSGIDECDRLKVSLLGDDPQGFAAPTPFEANRLIPWLVVG